MRISDWRSDGCSSDLCSQRRGKPEIGNDHACFLPPCAPHRLHGVGQVAEDRVSGHEVPKIGRASCRERVCQYVEMSAVAASLIKKKKIRYHKLYYNKHINDIHKVTNATIRNQS